MNDRPTHRHDGPYDVHYGHDPAGNVKQANDVDNTVVTYGYDATGRLVSALDTATGSFGSLVWTYDQNGNRQSETRNAGTTSYVYSPPNWLHQKGGVTRTRTLNGNTASISGQVSFAYDGFGRLVTSTTASETTTYSYNALGERIRKQNQNGLSTIFHYGPNGELLFEKNQQGKTKEYVWLDGRPIARIDNSTTIYYYHVDHLGTPRAMTNASGTVVWKADYEPFGKANVTTSTVENNLRFPGQYFDRETGLHYNYFRDYDPTTGRYIEADPIGLDGGMNLYAYVEGNPLIYVDPLGLKGGLFGKLLEELIPESIETTVGKGRGAKCATNLCKKKPSNLRIIEECAIQAKPSDSGFSGGILNECIETCKELLKKCDPDNCEDK